jgi:pimeloyl-ACP methyl ester carboxylesterase
VRLSVHEFKPEVPAADKPEVVLIHGTGADGTLWGPQVDALVAEGYRCLVPELRGHGMTHEPEEATSINVHIEDLLETLAAHNVTYPAIWIGHSLGAIILLQMVKQRPELFVEILAIGLPGKVPSLIVSIFRRFLGTPFEKLRGTVWQKKLPIRHQILIDTERHSLEQIVENFATINLVDQEHSLPCPIHFSVGRFDVVAPYIYAEKIHRAIPNSTFKIFEFAGHSCMDDQPQQFNDWLIEKVRGASRSRQKSVSSSSSKLN